MNTVFVLAEKPYSAQTGNLSSITVILLKECTIWWQAHLLTLDLSFISITNLLKEIIQPICLSLFFVALGLNTSGRYLPSGIMLLDLQFTKKGVCTALLQLIMAKLLAHSAEVIKSYPVNTCQSSSRWVKKKYTECSWRWAFLGHIESIS